MVYHYIYDGAPIRSIRELGPAIEELMKLAIAFGVTPEQLAEHQVAAHELAHALTYFRFTADTSPWVKMGGNVYH